MSRSGYYYWNMHHEQSHLRDAESIDLIKSAHARFHHKAGIRTIKMYLEIKHGITMNTKKIQRIKKTYCIITEVRRKNKYNTFNLAVHEDETAPNLLNRQFSRNRPHEVYSTDITYLSYGTGNRAYLSAVKDLSSREIVHHCVSRNIGMEIASEGLGDLLNKLPHEIRSKLIIHSDQGSHYRHKAFRSILTKYGVMQSMSRKGNCLDNAPIESFFGHMKDEIDLKACKTFNDVKDIVSDYIRYYNEDRPQWTLKKMTPVEYRCHLNS